VTPEQPAPWDSATAGDEAGDDDLLQQAIDLVREHQQASSSFLQRQMRIGYPRAARIMDQLEKLGIVGPSETGGRSRNVIDSPEGDPSPADTDDGKPQ
jgi:S-DNA-T family DNA segregation ATPase FtsK/SpoIIIE